MKKLFTSVVIASVLMVPALSLAKKSSQAQENFNRVLEKIQDTQWKGTFSVIGQWICNGTLDVYFFPK